jgi:tRNA(adenine34) deaminase
MKTSPFGAEQDLFYMRNALQQARRAGLRGEVPIGAIVVNEKGIILARASNKVEQKKMQTAHAEMRALERACKLCGDWRLDGCWIYVTLEPCLMCRGCIMLSRCAGIVYGASSPLFGTGLDSEHLPLYRKGSVQIIAGVAQEEAAALLKQFFKNKR